MDFPVFLNKFIIGNKYLRHTSFWYWFRLANHSNWRMDDHQRYWDFWNSVNQGILDMNYQAEFEKFWGKGSYPPEKILISSEDYDTIMKSLNEPPKPIPALTELLNRKTPFEND